MNQYRIVETDGIRFELVNEKSGERLSIMMQFLEMKAPGEGDTILLDSKLLDVKSECFAQPLTFIQVISKTKKPPKEELAGLVCDGKKIVLRRVFG